MSRNKTVRPEIIDNIVENRANEIVSFKVGYQFGEPVKYVGRKEDENITAQIELLNDMMICEGKHTLDRDLCEWWNICGTSYRMILPDKPDEADCVPFEMWTLDPSTAFVIYSDNYEHRPLAGVIVTYDENGDEIFSVYTRNAMYVVRGGAVVSSVDSPLGYIPIIEYKANNARLGCFEVVIPLLDAINNVESNRVEAVEQFVQALLVMYNVDMSAEDFDEMIRRGAVKLKSVDGVLKPDIQMLSSELNQTQTQTLKDDLYDTVLTICGMPSRNGNSGKADTGSAVVLRDGWSLAESRAKDEEWTFKKAENEFLKVVLRILHINGMSDLRLSDIDLHFTRRNFENIMQKAQVLDLLLKNPWVAPVDAYAVSGLFSDPEGAYIAGMDYYKSNATTAQTEPIPAE